MNFKSVLFFLFPFIFPLVVHSQEKQHSWIKNDSLFKFVQPSASMQTWATYTMGEKAQLSPNAPLESVQDRMNVFLRRARIGFKGKPYKGINYCLTIQYDNLGKDKFSAVRGATNTGQLGILDAFGGWKITKNELATVTFGYLHPQISRECITGDIIVNSFDKSPSQGYIRQHYTGKGYGRATGINLGGLTSKKGRLSLGYNVGIFNNNTTAEDTKKFPETTGKLWSPLLTSRVAFSIGDPDVKTYALNYGPNNYFNNRKGITVGLNATQQAKTETFNSNQALGIDLLFNYSKLNFDAEIFWLKRDVQGKQTELRTGHIRLGYNLIVANKYFIEPTASIVKFEGVGSSQFSGEDHYYDIGVNWYLNKQNYKMSLHYVAQDGHGNNTYTDGQTFEKGDYIGISHILIF